MNLTWRHLNWFNGLISKKCWNLTHTHSRCGYLNLLLLTWQLGLPCSGGRNGTWLSAQSVSLRMRWPYILFCLHHTQQHSWTQQVNQLQHWLEHSKTMPNIQGCLIHTLHHWGTSSFSTHASPCCPCSQRPGLNRYIWIISGTFCLSLDPHPRTPLPDDQQPMLSSSLVSPLSTTFTNDP